jgi:hypothetical protein
VSASPLNHFRQPRAGQRRAQKWEQTSHHGSVRVGTVVAEPDHVATPNHLVIPGGLRVKVIGERGKQMDRHVIERRATADKFTHVSVSRS